MSEVNEDPGWGGQWTEKKLQILRSYLEAYLKVMKNQPYRIGYVDAFAGTGYRKEKSSELAPGLFDDSEEGAPIRGEDAQRYRDGSARIALDLDPGFDTYIFIERDPDNFSELQGLHAAQPRKDVRLHHGEARDILLDLAGRDWSKHRAVVFLDPYGMQVEWEILQALAGTEAVDVWILAPIGIGANRMLTKRLSDMPSGWPEKLDRFFGTPNWRTELYKHQGQTLFDDGDNDYVRAAREADIARFYIERLESIFPHVVKTPRVLRNSNNQPLYTLCFAAANPEPKAGGAALRIAGHLLRSS